MVTQTNPMHVDVIESNNTVFQRIINTLLLNASFINNLGLMQGKMGISIFFFHLARKYENKIYEDYAGELIDKIYEEISVNTPINFEHGLAGIGWGIEYLAQNGFIEADTDDVLEEFDQRIISEFNNNPPKELNLLTGLLGFGIYFLNRIKNRVHDEKNKVVLTNRQMLMYLVDELDKRIQNVTEIIHELTSMHPSDSPEEEHVRNTVSIKSPLGDSGVKKHMTFDLTWNYPLLLWFLSELYGQNIFNSKIEKIIKQLIEPLTDVSNLPKLRSNKILLGLALTKLQRMMKYKQQTLKQSSNFQIFEPSNLQTIIDNLLKPIDRNSLKSVLPSGNITIRYGIAGLVWMYKEMYTLTREPKFKIESEYWSNQISLNIDDESESVDGTKNIVNWGFMEGFTGNIFVKELI